MPLEIEANSSLINMMNHVNLPKHTRFLFFLRYNFIFFALQLLWLITHHGSFLQSLPLPWLVWESLFITFCIHVGLYILLSLIETELLSGIDARWQSFIAIITIMSIVFGNAYFFPLSLFGQFITAEIPNLLILIILVNTSIILGLLTLNAIRTSNIIRVFIILVFLMLWLNHQVFDANSPKSLKPNIILIGIDSLPPSKVNPAITPTIDHFLKNSIHFKETITPLARTSPSWISILTGLNPNHHQTHYNLAPITSQTKQQSIAWLLQQKGYNTLFATDDRQFNTIDEQFGFQIILGPKRGATDILLSQFNDFPLSNLLMNLPQAQTLFPYNHLNRASFYTYLPKTFNLALQKKLQSLPQTKPWLIAVHFTLPHWPYFYAQSKKSKSIDRFNNQEQALLHAFNHTEALKAADHQVLVLLKNLKHFGFLKNSLIVMLSDHGETLYLPGSRPLTIERYQGKNPYKTLSYFKKYTSTDFDKSAGHGSDLLSPDQYHCVLGFQWHQSNRRTSLPKSITTRVSLTDIAPTLMDFAKIQKPKNLDGISLWSLIQNQNTTLPNRVFLLESGMLPNQFLTPEKARRLGRLYFKINPNNGLLVLKTQALPLLDKMKLHAMIHKEWLLARYPTQKSHLTILQNLTDGRWTDDLNTAFAQHSPAKKMQALFDSKISF